MAQGHNITLEPSDLVLMGYSGVLVHHKGVILYANLYAAKKAGFSNADDFIGRNIRDFIHPDDLPKIIARIEDMYANGTHYENINERFLDNKGHMFYMDVSEKPINYEGKPSILIVSNDMTHRKKIEVALRKSEERLSLAFQGSNDGLWDRDIEKNEVSYSARWKQILGYAKDELEDCFNTWERLLHPDDIERAKQAVADYLSHKTSLYESEFRMLHKDGSWIDILARGKTIPNKHTRFIGTHVDISKRKKAEYFTRQTSNILGMVASGVSASEVYEAICMMHENKYPQMRSSILELQGNHLVHCASPNLPQAYSQAIDGVEIGPNVGSCGTAAFLGKETIVANIATDPLWAAFKDIALLHNLQACWSEPIIGVDGSVLGTFAMYFDHPETPSEEHLDDIKNASKLVSIVMERDRRENSLRQSESLYRTLVENLPQRFFIKDKNSIFISCSENLAKDLQITVEKIVGTNDHDYFPKELAAHYQEDDRRIMQSKSAENIEEKIIIEGIERVIHTVKAPALDEQGNVEGIIGFYWDVTEIKELKEKFNQAQKMEAVGTLVGGIAHDFNNMLAAITGNIYLAKKAANELPDVVNRLEKVEDISLRAADMISQLLTFSRKGMVSIKELPLTPFIKETLKFIRASLPENIVIHQDICSKQLNIEGDSTQLYQVLINLMANARDAVENVQQPSITVRLETYQVNETVIDNNSNFKTGSYAHLSVEDNGYGIPESQLGHVFEPFFTTKEQGKGTGLGLSMIFGALKTHHGVVTIDSVEGKGSTFHIYIPLLNQQEIVPLPLLEKKSAHSSGELILLADDEQNLRKTTAEVLESMGYRVLQASDGLKALEVYKEHQEDIAIVLLDVVMPHMGGVQLAKELRKMKVDTPIIFMTGYARENVLDKSQQISNCDILTKPVQFSTLDHTIRQLID